MRSTRTRTAALPTSLRRRCSCRGENAPSDAYRSRSSSALPSDSESSGRGQRGRVYPGRDFVLFATQRGEEFLLIDPVPREGEQALWRSQTADERKPSRFPLIYLVRVA